MTSGVADFQFIASGAAKDCAPGEMSRQRYIQMAISTVESIQWRPDHATPGPAARRHMSRPQPQLVTFSASIV